MYTFIMSLVILILGYFTYGKYVEKVFGPDLKRPTPAIANPDRCYIMFHYLHLNHCLYNF